MFRAAQNGARRRLERLGRLGRFTGNADDNDNDEDDDDYDDDRTGTVVLSCTVRAGARSLALDSDTDSNGSIGSVPSHYRFGHLLKNGFIFKESAKTLRLGLQLVKISKMAAMVNWIHNTSRAHYTAAFPVWQRSLARRRHIP